MTPYVAAVLATPNLVALYPMDDVAGTGVVDLVGGNNGTRVNAPTTGVSLGFAGPDKGMTFVAASSQQVSIPNSAALQFGLGPYSIECWFYRTGDVGATAEYLIDRGVASAGGNGFETYLGDTGAYTTSRIGAKAVQGFGWTWGGVWHHSVATMDRPTVGTSYVDGQIAGAVSIASEAAFLASENAITYIGSAGGSNYLTGGVALVALYNRALDGGEVLAHYRAARNVPVQSLPAFVGRTVPQR